MALNQSHNRCLDRTGPRKRIQKGQIFREGNDFEMYLPFTEYFFKTIRAKDVFLAEGFPARVTAGFDSSDWLQEKWSKDKIPYSDLETRTTKYIVHEF